MNRRSFLIGCASISAAISFPALADETIQPSREITLQRGEIIETIQYVYDGHASPEAYSKICWLMRDVKADKIATIDPALLESLAWLQDYARRFGFAGPIQVLSGYRSKSTNTHDGGVQHSYHLAGRAIDFRLPGVSARSLGGVLSVAHPGGTGIYLKDDFVHIDSGDLRSWRV